MKPDELMELTPNEFYLLLEAQNERIYDQLEMKSIEAMMMRIAYHSDKKNLKPQDMFKRPTFQDFEKKNIEKMEQTMKQQQEWLNQFSFGKEESNG